MPKHATNLSEELVITRVFDAPRALVFKAWTEGEHLRHWSAPHGFTVPFGETDLRPGGRWRACMRRADGEELWVGGVYREIVEPERLVMTHAWEDDEGKPGPETLITVILAERDGKTAMTFKQTGFRSAEDREGHAGGWAECFDRLEELLAGRKVS